MIVIIVVTMIVDTMIVPSYMHSPKNIISKIFFYFHGTDKENENQEY